MQGLLLDVIQKEAPEAYEKRTKRQGIVNAWEDKNFANAVRATEKRQLIVAGVTTDVCLVPPALSMQAEGFHIKVTYMRKTFRKEKYADSCSVCLMLLEVQRIWLTKLLGSDYCKLAFRWHPQMPL